MFYCRYVDDTFAVFNDEEECDQFLHKLNNLHPSLVFTSEKENNGSLSFLDVLVARKDRMVVTDVFRKQTFTGDSMKWSSFSPKSTKVKLIGTLVHRAIMICSSDNLQCELDRLTTMFVNNGYPDEVIRNVISRKLKSFQQGRSLGPLRRPILMKLPYIGERSIQFGRRITGNVTECFGFVEVKTIFTTRSLRVNPIKDVLPTFSRSNVVYKFECHCGSEYVGRTGQSLITRIGQHVPDGIRSSKHAVTTSSKSNALTSQVPSLRRSDRIKARVAASIDPVVPSRRSARIAKGDEEEAPKTLSPKEIDPSWEETKSSSAIEQHLIANSECAKNYDDSRFSILAFARNFSQLKFLEAIFITSRKPMLCKQKRFSSLRIFNRF